MERRRGLSSWIRFRDGSLQRLLEGVEAVAKEVRKIGCSSFWVEEGRQYGLERKANKAGSFFLCSARDANLKKHYIVFPEGKGLVGGWVLLAKKLRILRVEPKVRRPKEALVQRVGR